MPKFDLARFCQHIQTHSITFAYVVPPAAALTGSRAGAAGYAAAVVGRLLASRFCAAPTRWDAVAHPVSVLAMVGLLVSSWVGRVRGTLRWKGRSL